VVADVGDTPPLADVVVVGVVVVCEVAVGVVAEAVVELLAVVAEREVAVEATFLGGGTGTGVAGVELPTAPHPASPSAAMASHNPGYLTAFLNVAPCGVWVEVDGKAAGTMLALRPDEAMHGGGRQDADRRAANCSERPGRRVYRLGAGWLTRFTSSGVMPATAGTAAAARASASESGG
jgi:hypothetical protein